MTLKLDSQKNPLQAEIEQACDVDLDLCYECGKCSGGCSNGHIFDFTPRKIIQLIRLGSENVLLRMDALSACVACQICFDRCPSGIDIPGIMDYLHERARRAGIPASRPRTEMFNELFLKEIARRGRISETALMAKFIMRTGDYRKDLRLGWRLFLKGKLNLFVPRVKNLKALQAFFGSERKD